MGEVVGKPGLLTLEEVQAAIAFNQPKLHATANGADIRVQGTYLVFENGVVANPAGPISEFDIEIVLSARYPRCEPRIFEVGGLIPREPDRHINPDGDCCVTVWEHWLLTARDRSFAAYLNGPVNEFFLGQYWYEKTGTWPFGERPHGQEGLIEAYTDVLGIRPQKMELIYYLRLLSQDWPKGHWLCPCGSRKRLRYCHRADLMLLHGKVPPRMAKLMLKRVASQEPVKAHRHR
ncbi:MAG TPA: hypothetical protein PKE41_10965 [Candidatus Macondimonas sp.]|nr:hypothetical protein [Candidatus Macondimonas sp.]